MLTTCTTDPETCAVPVNYADPEGLLANPCTGETLCGYRPAQSDDCFLQGMPASCGLVGALVGGGAAVLWNGPTIYSVKEGWAVLGFTTTGISLQLVPFPGPDPLSEASQNAIKGAMGSLLSGLGLTQSQIDSLIGGAQVSSQQYGGHWNLTIPEDLLKNVLGDDWQQQLNSLNGDGWRSPSLWDSIHIANRHGGLSGHVDCSNGLKGIAGLLGHFGTDLLLGNIGVDLDAICRP